MYVLAVRPFRPIREAALIPRTKLWEMELGRCEISLEAAFIGA